MLAGNLLFAQGGFVKTFTLQSDTVIHRTAFPNIAELKPKEPKIALALSGGGAKGFAHIGVLKQLEKNNIHIDAIYGTSIGSVVGGFYAIGYNPDELIATLKTMDIGALFSLSKGVKREYLYQDQKIYFSKSFITLRFKNFIPILPSFLTSGQELTNQINRFVLQGLYHTENFEDLPIKFYAVCTDLITGHSVVLSNGNLSNAIRGSLTWPLLNPPVSVDNYKLIDGGIRANIPVNFPKQNDYDIVIAVNVTSGMKPMEDTDNAGEIFDRLLSITQLEVDERELDIADIIIKPDLQKYTATSFGAIDTLVALGEVATLEKIDTIKNMRKKLDSSSTNSTFFVNDILFSVLSDANEYISFDEYGSVLNERIINDDSIIVERKIINDNKIIVEQKEKNVSEYKIIETLKSIKRLGYFKNVYCDVTKNLSGYQLNYKVETYPVVKNIYYSGNTLLSEKFLDSVFYSFSQKPFNHFNWHRVLETVNREYRKRNLSLAKVHHVSFDSLDNTLYLQLREGKINGVYVVGNENTQEFMVLREFPLKQGNLFNIELATRGLSNIFSTDLFETVLLEVDYIKEEPDLFIKVVEKPTELVRLGLRVDNERQTQFYVALESDNFLQSSGDIGMALQTGYRDFLISTDYRMNKIFKTPFFTKLQLNYWFENQNEYIDNPFLKTNRWESKKSSEFKELKYGGSFTVGSLYKKIGYLFAEYKLEYQETKELNDMLAKTPIGNETVSSLKFGLLFDSRDEYPFPKKGSYFNGWYEFASSLLSTGVAFTKTFFNYDLYIPFSKLNILHPKIVFGFADNSLPYTEQFKLGGQNSFFGLRENNYRGRQIFTGSLEYRHQFPLSFLFDIYLSLRYDIGSVWEETTKIKLSTLMHAIGSSVFFDTPIGPSGLSLGQSFKLTRDLPDNPLSFGPFYIYFSLGFTLD